MLARTAVSCHAESIEWRHRMMPRVPSEVMAHCRPSSENDIMGEIVGTTKTRAEIVFEGYLSERGLTFEHEAVPGRRKPDYLIHGPSGDCIVEVKQIEDPDPHPSGGFSAARSVRAKIRSARRQFGEYKHFACSLAIYSESIFGPNDPVIILSGAFGPGYQQAGRDYSKIDPNPSFYRFCTKSELPPDKSFLANAMLSPVANTTFSALIMLTYYQLSELHLEVWRRLYAMQEAGRPVDTHGQFRLLNELAPILQGSVRFPSTVRAIVVENRHARIPFPKDLFRGPFDQRWGWSHGWCGPTWLGATLEALYEDGVPFHML
ncbi:hypothetical protein [Paludibaculum fermentans]|uniref:hypothetical protein n=1 Tax=Paludibaculum fermentans TaxID=1473598 RepID=UPI003EC09AB2